jgi:hypothetical protein
MKPIQTLITGALLTITSLAAIAQDDSTAVTKKNIQLNAFNGIVVGGNFNVVLTEASTPKVMVETKNNNQQNIVLTVIDNNLVVSSNGKKNAKTTIYIDAPTIKNITLTGSAELKTSNKLLEEQLNLTLSGASEANMEVAITNLESKISGAAELKLNGTVINHTTTISGAGELKALKLASNNTTAKMSGAGHAQVEAKEELNAKITGASSISFKEEPKIKNIDVSGAGSVTQKEEDTEIAKAEMNANGDSDTTRFSFKDKRIIIIDGNDPNKKDETKKAKKKSQTWSHWSGVELGFNTMVDYKNSTDLGSEYNYLQSPGKSYHVALNFWEKGFNIYKNNVKVVTGLGLEFENYSIKNNVILNVNGPLPIYTLIPTLLQLPSMPKNKIRANYLTVPLMLDFNTSHKEKKNWHISTGIIAAWKYSSYGKQTVVINNHNVTTKTKADYDMNNFKFSATLRAGYRGINLFANYGLNTLFNKSNNPDFYPVTVGITAWPFK